VILPNVGQVSALASLGVSGSSITLADVTTTAGQSYAGNVRLGGNLSSTASGGVAVNGSLALLSNATISAAGGGAINVSGTVNGGHVLILSTPSGNIALSGGVGGSTPLSALTLDSAGASLGSVFTSGSQSYQVKDTQLAGVLNSTQGAIDLEEFLRSPGTR